MPPADERMARSVDCLRRAGLEPTVDDNFLSYELRFPEEQGEAIREIIGQCRIEGIGFDPEVTPILPPTDEALERHYYALVEAELCLTAQGADTPVRVSKESFVESGGANWHPYYVGVPGIDIAWDEWDRLNAVCPRPSM